MEDSFSEIRYCSSCGDSFSLWNLVSYSDLDKIDHRTYTRCGNCLPCQRCNLEVKERRKIRIPLKGKNEEIVKVPWDCQCLTKEDFYKSLPNYFTNRLAYEMCFHPPISEFEGLFDRYAEWLELEKIKESVVQHLECGSNSSYTKKVSDVFDKYLSQSFVKPVKI